MANFNLNKVTLGGRLTGDPELKTTPQGNSVVSFSIAVNRKGKDAGTDFINCVAWRSTAELIGKYFKKGNSICVDGEIQTRSFEQNGQKRTVTEIKVNEIYFVDGKSDAAKIETPNAPKFEEVSGDEDLPF
jgi:single-strand DNA-binding protein